MATYAQLQAEPVWRSQRTPAGIAGFVEALKQRGITAYVGGDNNHLTGRHRSMRWCLTSAFCTRRSYGTQDKRDTAGDPDVYRATDVMIEGVRLQSVCRRLDTAVRARKLPGLAEWFGTFDSKRVVGWYEGATSTSDDSHLTHLHLGYWTTKVDDAAMFATLLAIIDDRPLPPTSEDDMRYILVRFEDAEDPNTVWLANGMTRRHAKPEWLKPEGSGPMSNAQVFGEGFFGPLLNGGKVYVSKGDPDVWGVEIPDGGHGGGGGLVPHTHETGPAKPTA